MRPGFGQPERAWYGLLLAVSSFLVTSTGYYLVKPRRWRHYFGMARMLILLGIAALIASPASAALKPDPKPIPRRQPALPPPVFRRVAPPPVIVHPVAVHPTSAERAAATRRAAKARAAKLVRLREAAGKARAVARKKSVEARRRAHPSKEAIARDVIASRPNGKAAVPDTFLPVLLACAIAFLILAASPAAIPLARRFGRARRGVRLPDGGRRQESPPSSLSRFARSFRSQ